MSSIAAALDTPARAVAFQPSLRAVLYGAMALCLLPLLLQLPRSLGLGIGAAAVVVAIGSWRRPLPGLWRIGLALALIGLVLASARGFGRDSACALLAAMLAIKPAETVSLRDARSLLGFALYAVFATFLLDQGPLSLLLGLFAAAAVMVVLQRLADVESGLPDTSSLAARAVSVGRLLALGLPLALAGFWLFPRLGAPLWGVPERAMARPGLSDSMSPGEWIDLMNDDTPAARVRFFGPAPATSQMYWRGPVLWTFDGRTWRQPQWLRGIPPAPVRAASAGWDYELEIEPTDLRQLVALDLLTAAPDGSQLSLDHGLYVRRPLASLSRWRMRSAPAAQYEPELRRTLRQWALQLPEGFNPRTRALAARWRAEAGDTADADSRIVRRAMDWVRRDFAYTLETPLLGRHTVDEFLFDQQAGFCEHFSGSFVFLMRAAGIPARVVTGYAGGYRNPFGDYWLVRRSDAHAWAEVWLPQRGWTRVDPTAAVAPERIYDTLADRAPGAGGLFGGLTPMWNAGDWLRRGWNDFVLGFDATRQQRMLRPLGLDGLDPGRLFLLFAGIAAATLGGIVWWLARGEALADPLLRAWHRLGQRYARLGLARAAHETAGDWAARVGSARPAADLTALAARFAQARYAGAAAEGSWRQLIRDLQRHRPSADTAPSGVRR